MINKECIDKIKIKLEEYSKEINGYSGQILVAMNGVKVFSRSYGMANYEHDVPNTNTTKFRICSISKQFTAVLIMQLVEAGLLCLNDKLDKYFADYPNADKITIHQLLTHTSGIPDYTDEEYYDKVFKRTSHTVNDILEFTKSLPTVGEPGEKCSYSNTGYTLLACIVEKITQKSYEDNLQEKIFNRLSMTNSGVDNNYKKVIKGKAYGYDIDDDGKLSCCEYMDMTRCFGAGEIYSTAEDLFLWNNALYSGKLLNKETFDIMISKQEMFSEDQYYGYGLFICDNEVNGKNYREVYHDGSMSGFLTINSVVDNNAFQLINLTNAYNLDHLNDILDNLQDIIYSEL